jgi:hypothetical protein
MSCGQKQLKGEHQALVHSGQVALVMARQGGWTTVQQLTRTFRSNLNLKRSYQAGVHSGQMVLVVVRQGCWTTLTGAKIAQMRVGKQL